MSNVVAAANKRGMTQLRRLHADLQSACLLFLDTRSLLRWRAVAGERGMAPIFASQGHAQRHLQRLLLELHHSKDHLQHVSDLASRHHLPSVSPASLVAAAAGGGATALQPPVRKVLNIGHKGAEGHVKGNTMESFHKAVELGVDVIEFDVVACLDGVLCHHDAVDEGTGRWYKDLTVAQVRSILGRRHPTLDEMLRDRRLRDSGVHLYFDLKHTHIVRPTMRSIVHAVTAGGWPASRIIVATFKQVELLEINAFRRAIPELKALRTAAILDAIPLSLAKDFEALGCAAVSVGQYCVCPEFVADCHRRGLQMWAWTVNARCMVEELFRLGIDGICTDYPGLVTEVATARAAAAAPVTPAAGGEGGGSAVAGLLHALYGPLADARGASAAAIDEARAMADALERCGAGSAAQAPEEAAALTALLRDAEAAAAAALQPVLMSADAFKWMFEVIRCDAGGTVMAAVARELASCSAACPLLDFERQFLMSASSGAVAAPRAAVPPAVQLAAEAAAVAV